MVRWLFVLWQEQITWLTCRRGPCRFLSYAAMSLQVPRPVISFCEFHGFSRRAWGSFSRGRSMDEPHASLQLANEPHTRREKGVLCAKTVTFSNAVQLS